MNHLPHPEHTEPTNSTPHFVSPQNSMTTLLETCQVPPPPDAAAALSVPLSFFDITWLHFHPIRLLLFFDHPCSKDVFLNTLVPNLKQSLSLALRNYLPVAGNLLYPLDTDQKPLIRYVSGDSVTLAIAESSRDLDELAGNHARDADQMYDVMPQTPTPLTDEPNYKKVPLMVLQLTLFPGRGVCLASANHHTLGDARSMTGFMSAWCSINKHGGDGQHLINQSPPTFDRSVIHDPLSIETIFWKVLRNIPLKPSFFPVPTNRVRATFILTQADIKKLKDSVLVSKPGLVKLSSLVTTASYIWSCFAKSGDEADDEDARELFILPADARGRTDPPIPENYFGNCIVPGIVIVKRKRIVGEEGFVNAVEAICEEINGRLNSKDEILKGAENWVSNIMNIYRGISALAISGSPKFDWGDVDFGWGRARKLEVLSIDKENYSMSMSKCRDEDGGLEVGMSLPRKRMEAFASVFAQGLSL